MNALELDKKINDVWFEKYRPQTMDDLILEPDLRIYFEKIIEEQKLPQHLMLYGSAGVGKGSIINVLVNAIPCTVCYIDGSADNKVENIREKIIPFAKSGRIFKNQIKLVIINESDRLTPEAMDALKDILETGSLTCRFIFACNRIERMIEPIKSRCLNFRIKPPIKEVCTKICQKLKEENIPFEVDAVVAIVKKKYPDFRGTWNELQSMAISMGEISTSFIKGTSDEYKSLFTKLFNMTNIKEISELLKKSLYDESIYTELAKYLIEKYESADAVIVCSEGMSKATTVYDTDLNLLSTILTIKEIIK